MIDESRILPRGYRIRTKFVFLERIAGEYRWLETVRVVQRFMGSSSVGVPYNHNWHDVGYWDEIDVTALAKPGIYGEELA